MSAVSAMAAALAWGLCGCASVSATAGASDKATAHHAVETGSATGPSSSTHTVAASLPRPDTPRTWTEAREQAARRMVLANPARTYMGPPPDILLAIPVLTIELNGDGSIRRIVVLRHPRQAHDTVTLAMDAVRRAAPFGDVSRLPRPWKFNETFLFDDARRFKPMTLNLR